MCKAGSVGAGSTVRTIWRGLTKSSPAPALTDASPAGRRDSVHRDLNFGPWRPERHPGSSGAARARKLQAEWCVHLFMDGAIAYRACLAAEGRRPRPFSGQWRAMRDGNAGTYGTYGNVVSVSSRI